MYEYTANGSLLYKSNNYLEHFEEATSAGEQEERVGSHSTMPYGQSNAYSITNCLPVLLLK